MRLGRNKALEKIGGKSLLERVILNLESRANEILVVSAAGILLPEIKTNKTIRFIKDVRPGKGPLVGIYSGLLASCELNNLVVACDMPFLNGRLLDYIISQVEDNDIVIPKLNSMVEPLHAVYSKRCIPSIEEMLDCGDFKVNGLLKRVIVRYICNDEINRFDPEHLSFFNINTRADFKKADRLAQKNSRI